MTDAGAPPDGPATPDDLVVLPYSSGTTGLPKGVMLSHRNIRVGAISVADYLGLAEDDRLLSVLPYSFDAGLNQLTTMLLTGGTIVHQPLTMPAEIVRMAAAELPEPTEVVFTAHSLPARILDDGDPYPDQLRETAEAVAARAGIERWRIGWQSAGRTPEPWIGPDVLEVLDELASNGTGGVLVCPAGFTSDHLEILYDLDIEARALAEEAGIRFERTEMPNADPAFCRVLAQVVREHLAGG